MKKWKDAWENIYSVFEFESKQRSLFQVRAPDVSPGAHVLTFRCADWKVANLRLASSNTSSEHLVDPLVAVSFSSAGFAISCDSLADLAVKQIMF